MKAYLTIDCPKCGDEIEVAAQPERGPGLRGLELDVIGHQYCTNQWDRDQHTTAYCRTADAYEDWLQPPEAA